MDCIVDVQQSMDDRLIALDNMEMVRQSPCDLKISDKLNCHVTQLVESIDNANGAPSSIHLTSRMWLTWAHSRSRTAEVMGAAHLSAFFRLGQNTPERSLDSWHGCPE
jgi:hypothetical protein